MASVVLTGVSKVYQGDVTAVKDANINIRDGEFFTLLGPSGCGKTTILRMIAGFIYPTSGRIRFGEQDVTFTPPNRRNTAMVFQNYALFPHMTVYENVAFGLQVRKVSRAETQRRVAEALDQVHLAGMQTRRIDQLSGGQQQRVALARALVVRPRLLLLDEPLSNLDAKLREETRGEIRRLQKEAGITTVYVTHDQAEALAVSDRIAVMNQGAIHQIGSPQEVYHRPVTHFVASFIGRSNVLGGQVDRCEGSRAWVRINDALVLEADLSADGRTAQYTPGQEVVVVIRPETIELARGSGQANVLAATVRSSEFNGANVEYVAEAGGLDWIVWIPGHEANILQPGETLRMHVPPEHVYLVEPGHV